MSERRFLVPPAGRPIQPGNVPSFSIAIPAYQAAASIGEAIDSALEQTLRPREVVVCDDGSTDETAAVVARYGERVRLVRQPNSGSAVAKTTAAAETTADFVAFLDADDVYLPTRLEAIGELAAERPDLDVITTNAELEVDGAVVGRYYDDVARFPVEQQVRAVVSNDSTILSAAAVRSTAFHSAGGFRGGVRSGYDWELWIRLAVHGSRFGCVDEPLYRYRLHDRGQSADQVSGWQNGVTVLARVLEAEQMGADDRAAVECALAYYRRGAALVAAEHALLQRAPQARVLSWSIARDPAQGPSTRAKAAFAAAAPGAAGALLRTRERRTGRSRVRRAIPSR